MPYKRAEQHSVVILGALNPAIFHPSWPPLADVLRTLWGVSGPEDAKSVECFREFSRFQTGSASFHIDLTRFQLLDDAPTGRRLADLAEIVFGKYLPHTPCTAVGINYQCIVQCKDIAERDHIGYTLVPPEPWNKDASRLRASKGGMVHLSVRLPVEDKDFDANQMVTIEAVGNEGTSFAIRVNNHFGFKNSQPIGEIVGNALSRYDNAIADGSRIADGIIDL